MRHLLAAPAFLLLTQCNPPAPPPAAPPVTPVASVSVPAPLASAAPPAAPLPPAPKPAEPPAPRLVSAGAMLVWIEESSAVGGFRTTLVEPGPGGAKIAGERPAVVVASSKELWVLRTKKTRYANCGECDKCNADPAKCKKNEAATVDEPYLESLGTARVVEPWQKTFTYAPGCAAQLMSQDAAVTPAGAVGNLFFADVTKVVTSCGGDTAQNDEALAFDLDAEKPVEPTLPDAPTHALTLRAQAEIVVQDCTPDRTEVPTLYRARAAYGDDGVLHGLYAFTMTAQTSCASGPDHDTMLNEQKSPWIPTELAAYGKLPAFVVTYMAERRATFAMPVAADRVAAAEKEMARTEKELAALEKDLARAH
ncbi:MAG TPA: hypothetical protein VHS09_05135 [Polyangiaceae bacterium]|jgi:hypothetical protein|nr:hypothetical protein [Polyangiaceae bacterium]